MSAIHFTNLSVQEAIASGKPVVVDIWAEWCGPCKMMSPKVDNFANLYEGRIIVGKLDAGEEANEDFCADFGVVSIPTLLFFKNGELVNRSVGNLPEAELKPIFDSLL